MSDFAEVRCSLRVDDGGFPHRGPVILARERARLPGDVVTVQRGGLIIGDPPDLSDGFAFGPLDDAFEPDDDGDVDGILVPPAAFVAGRCEVHDAAAAARLDERLRGVLAALDPDDLSAWAPAYVESAMALALRGDDGGVAAIRGIVGGGRRTSSDGDHLAAYYLAQTGDPSGWPALVAELGHKTAHYRLMAARHLVAFRPYDGSTVEGDVIDVRARLVSALDDPEPMVTGEIPALLAEAQVAGLTDLLQSVVAGHRHRETRQVAEDVLERVGSGVAGT